MLEEYGLQVCKDKCEIFHPSVEYLGYVIDVAGLHKALSKVESIVDAPAPQSISQLRSLLGQLNYYERFIPQLATLLRPLHELLCQNKAWKWTEACDTAFKKAKAALTDSEVLMHFGLSLHRVQVVEVSPY
ncbi:uncharacterized mitochondrial protein AtMg00860-like [Carcharodon carcharias]|uniref:uncharacterized mitochondrial protein AtMg00860-like n=1 Tax=Carcharodon carcharias TaxID=13397 RepID=UPI001B7DFE9A|nr:uncharacterized mitochondrial protein AtMg00860-like [Carcharodon carcharias]